MTETHSIHIKVDSTDAQKASKNLSDMEKATNGAEKALINLTRAAVGLVTLEALKRTAAYAIEAADSFTLMSSKLKLATSSQEEFTKAQTALFKIAQANSTELASTVDLYTRVSRGMKEMGSSQADILKMTNAVGQALKISGASTSEASSVITQFGQALGSGVLRGEEFNAIMENGNRLARALADGLGVPLGSLRKLAEQGQLTGDIVTKAILSQTAALNSEASTMQTTVSQAWTQLENAVVTYIGEADQANGTTRDLSEAIVTLAKNFTDLADPIANALSYIAKVEVGGWLALSEAIGTAKIALQEMVGIQQAGSADPEVLKLMKMGQGQMSLDEIAGKQAEATEKTVAKSAAATGIHLANTGKAAKKAADEAQKAFQATIQANVSAAENAAKIFSAQMDNQKKRYEIEADQIKGNAELKIRATKSESMRLAIAEEAQTKIVEAISNETNLRQESLSKEMEITQAKLAGVKQELDAADTYKLKQAERIDLLAKQSELEAELAVKREERISIELDAIGQIQSAERDLAEARQQANEALVKEEALRQLEIMSSNLEYAKEMATGLAEAFGEVGAAIGGMSVAMAEYDKQSATIEIARKEAVDKAEGDQKRITEINDDAAKKQTKAEIKKYGDMAQAAQGFFKKNTAGYKAMETATKAFRAIEIAQSAMTMAQKLDDIAKSVAAFVTGETTKAAASAATLPTVISVEAGKQIAYAKTDIAAQGGIPIVGFALMGAMAALLAAFGIAGGGGGGGAPSIPEIPTGAGTVKGDPMAQSESISKSLAILEENSSNDLNYSADMLEALLAIKSALAGVEKQIANTLMPAISDLTMKYGTDALKQAGFLFRDQKLTNVLASGKLQGYIGARIETESEDGIKKGQNLIAGYGPKFAKLFGDTIKTVVTSIEEAGKSIGVSEGEIRNRLTNFVISLGKINVAGMNAEEAAKQVEAAISAMSDSMAEQALPEFKAFWKSGEGYKETIVRVAEGIQRATGNLELLGMEAINYTEITDKQKDVAAEITRQTIMAQGDLSEGTREYVRQLEGGAEDIVSSYKQILAITNLMRGAGFGTEDIDRTMINAAGGLSAFEEALQSFRENFMTDAQRVAADSDELTQAFGKLGFALPKSKDEFYAIAMGMDKSTEEGKKLFAQFMLLNGKFSDLTDASKDLADAQAEAAQAASDAAKKAQEDLIAGLQKTVDTALSDMKKAYTDLQKVQDRFIKLSQNLKNYLDDITGAASPYTSPEERYRIAKAEFQRVAELARSGNEEALGSLATASKDLLTASREYNASSEQFQVDFASVTQAIQDSMAYTQSQVDLAAKQLAYAEASYTELATINGSVISVAQGIAALNSSMASYTSAVAALAKANVAAPTTYTPPATPGTPANPIPVPKVPVTVSKPAVPFIPGGAAGSNYFANNNRYKYSELDAQNIIRFYYNQLLGRDVESTSALMGWANQLISGSKTTNEIAQMFKEGAEYRELVGRGFVPGFAKGGMAYPGLALVGEQGPELVSFGTQAHVSTASQTQGFFSGLQASIEKGDADQTNELQALVRLQSAANQQLIKEMKELKGEMAELARKAKIEAAA